MTIYKLEYYLTDSKSGISTYSMYYYKSNEECERFKEALKSTIKPNDHVQFNVHEIEFDDIKDSFTISQYENLFNTKLNSNQKLNIDDFKEGMWVWNQTESMYQQLRYISTGKDYHWVDGWGNIIENDDIYNYQITNDSGVMYD